MTTIHKINKREFLKQGIVATSAITCAPVMSFAGNSGEKLWEWSKEGLYWSSTPRGTKCLICPNECVIKRR